MAQVINGMIVGKVGTMTYYEQDGKQMVRTACNIKNKRKTGDQFKQMMHFLNRNHLWMVMKWTEKVFFEGEKSSAQRQFLAANNNLPDVYLPKSKNGKFNAVLQPGMVVSDGPLPSFNYQLGEFQGEPALLTTLTEADAQKGELLLYVFQQVEKDQGPSIKTKVIDLRQPTDGVKVTIHEGHLVLTCPLFSDNMSGFGLVHVVKEHASHQTIVTNCTYYQQFTTEDALMEAARSYGRLEIYNEQQWYVTLPNK